MLVPTGILAAGLARLVGNPASLVAEIPTYVLLWYAFDSYTKLHYLASAKQQDPAAESPSPPESAAPADDGRMPGGAAGGRAG